jgi:UbiD family decarboxylase
VIRSLQQYLDSIAEQVWHVEEPVALRHGVTALQYELDRRRSYPPLVIHKPLREDRSVADIPVVTNLTASRELVAAALGLTDHRQNAAFYGGRTGEPQDPVVIPRTDAPVQQVVLEGSRADVTGLPGVWQHELDPGAYLTAAHATT